MFGATCANAVHSNDARKPPAKSLRVQTRDLSRFRPAEERGSSRVACRRLLRWRLRIPPCHREYFELARFKALPIELAPQVNWLILKVVKPAHSYIDVLAHRWDHAPRTTSANHIMCSNSRVGKGEACCVDLRRRCVRRAHRSRAPHLMVGTRRLSASLCPPYGTGAEPLSSSPRSRALDCRCRKVSLRTSARVRAAAGRDGTLR